MIPRMKTEIITVLVKDLMPADWNYKTEGTPEQISKLAASISEDKSAGVPAVRELDGAFEVIDGNHRLQAIVELGWQELKVENFGEISKATAILIARRRNHKWFEDDVLQYAELFANDVLSEYDMDDLTKFMPDERDELEALSKLLDFDWSQFDRDIIEGGEDLETRTVKIVVDANVYSLWLQWKTRCEELMEYESDARCFEFAMVEALNTVGVTE